MLETEQGSRSVSGSWRPPMKFPSQDRNHRESSDEEADIGRQDGEGEWEGLPNLPVEAGTVLIREEIKRSRRRPVARS